MIKHLFPFLLAASFIVSCSKSSDPTKEPVVEPEKISLGNDSLVTRLNLKITDKADLKIESQLNKDSKGNYLVSGIKNNKFWLGYFDRYGKELLIKTYTEDPIEMNVGYGNKLSLSFNRIFRVIEVNGLLFIIRHINHSSTYVNAESFIEDLSILNTETNLIKSEYTSIIYETNPLATWTVYPFHNGSYIICKQKQNKFGDPGGEIIGYIYEPNGTFINQIAKPYVIRNGDEDLNSYYFPGLLEDCITISYKELLIVSARIVNLIKTDDMGLNVYSTIPFPNSSETDIIAIKSKLITNNVLTITAESISFEGQRKTLTTKINVNTGELVK